MGRPAGRPRLGTRRPRRRRQWFLSPDGFRALRHSCLLSQREAAAYLGVCLRTVRHWDSGRNRVPWSAVRLLRLLRAGDLGGLHEEWAGWTINRLGLHAPDGRTFRERDMRHHWLTLTQAALFREGYGRATPPDAPTSTQEARAGVQHLFGVPASRRPSPIARGRRPERLEGASTFPARMVGQREASPGETAATVGPAGTPPPRQTAFAPSPACGEAPAMPADAGTGAAAAGGGQTGAPSSRRERKATRSGAGLVSSLKQVAGQGQESSNGAACEGVPDAR